MLIPATEVARKCGYSLSYFRKRWRRWRRESGFPEPAVGFKWESTLIDAWLQRNKPPEAMELEAPPPRRRPRLVEDEAARQRRAHRDFDRA